MHMHIHICARACVHACKYARARTYICICMRACVVRACVCCMWVYGYMCVYVCVYIILYIYI